jgi:D-alanyl-D-alanine carboxypeptidase
MRGRWMSGLVAVAALAVPAGARAQTPRLPEAEVVARLGALLDSLAAAGRFAGVVVLALDTARVFERAFGMADRERGIANALDTRFNIGSINKTFTAVAIHQLAARGLLHLDDTLGEHLPDFPGADARARVTIRHLLEHRSGIGGNIFAVPAGGTRDAVRTTADFLSLVDERLRFEPGTRQEYSNAGYVVLGAVIERLSGTSYYDHMRANLFEPLGLHATEHLPKDALPPGTAIGYTRSGPGATQDGPLLPNTATLPGRGSAAGGGYSTAYDLLRFAAVARQGEVAGARAGLGIAGGAPGINALLETALPGGYDLVVLASMDPPVAERIGQRVRSWLGAS